MSWQPIPENQAILYAAMGHINSIDYRVGARWVFYRLLQDNFYTQKEDYKRWIKLSAKARKEDYDGWMPNTLVDNGRHVIGSGQPRDVNTLLRQLPWYTDIKPNIFEGATSIPFLIFEADTMSGQFQHFASDFDRAALRGDASLDHKWNIAMRIDDLYKRYKLPVHVLYFGDCDPKGLIIPESAMNDIWEWAEHGEFIKFTRIGINPEHAKEFNIQHSREIREARNV